MLCDPGRQELFKTQFKNATLQVSPRGIQVVDSGYGSYLLGIQRCSEVFTYYWVRSTFSLPLSPFSGVLGRRCRPPCGYFVGPFCRAPVSPRLLQSTMVPRGVCGWYVGTYLFCFFPGRSSFSSCGGFSVVHAFFGVFGFSADSRYCPRVASSSQLRKLDGNPLIWVVRGSPPVVSWHTLDRNLPIWVVRGSPPVVRWPTLDGNPAILRQGPALRAKARQEQTVPPPPRGIPSP